MKMTLARTWNVSVTEATAIQKELRPQIRLEKLSALPHTIAGADVSFTRYSPDLYACVVVFSYPELDEVERVFVKGKAQFPYVPGYLSFREMPLLFEAFDSLKQLPDVVMADGQGVAHPRRLGIATHLGLALDILSCGCAKSILYGKASDPERSRGSTSELVDQKTGEVIGASVRTKEGVKPVIVSAGNRITLAESISLVFLCARGYRIPEPTRRAHDLVNAFRRGELE